MVEIRLAEARDAEKMLYIQEKVISEGKYLITEIEEFSQTVEGQYKWIEAKQLNKREVIFVAEIQDEVVGWIVFQSPSRIRMAHTGSLGMMVLPDYRHRGVGKALLNALLEWAIENPLIEKVCLGVFSTNENAIKLYKNMGFKEEGRKVREIKLNRNEYIDDILMYKFV